MLRVNPTDYGEAIKQERDRRNLTQAEAARQIAVATRTLQAWEAGEVVPWARHRRAIVAWLENGNGEVAA
jgi:transcriptional regulator with XRE-family HTH domain